MGKVLSKIVEITGWLFTISGVVIVAVTVPDPKDRAIWILSVILGWVIIAWSVTILVYRNLNKELQNQVSTPQMSNCYIEDYDEHDDTLAVSNAPMIAYHSLVTICWKGSGVAKPVGYGVVNLKDTTKSTIEILTLFKEYEADIRNRLKKKKRSDYLDIYVQPVIYEDEYSSVVKALERKRGIKDGETGENQSNSGRETGAS